MSPPLWLSTIWEELVIVKWSISKPFSFMVGEPPPQKEPPRHAWWCLHRYDAQYTIDNYQRCWWMLLAFLGPKSDVNIRCRHQQSEGCQAWCWDLSSIVVTCRFAMNIPILLVQIGLMRYSFQPSTPGHQILRSQIDATVAKRRKLARWPTTSNHRSQIPSLQLSQLRSQKVDRFVSLGNVPRYSLVISKHEFELQPFVNWFLTAFNCLLANNYWLCHTYFSCNHWYLHTFVSILQTRWHTNLEGYGIVV